MFVVADFTVTPIGIEVSHTYYVAEIKKIVLKAGLNHLMHSCGTNIEGEWNEVMKVIKECHQTLHRLGVPTVNTKVSVGTRLDKPSSIDSKIMSVNTILEDESL